MKRFIWCFPGLGKSNLDIPGLSVVDADSNCFQFKGVEHSALHGNSGDRSFVRDEGYPQNYFGYIQSVEADVVLLNCHISLLYGLDKENVLVVYPSEELVPEYLERYSSRGDHASFISHMALEAKGIIQVIENSSFEKYRVSTPGTYLADLFEKEDFKVKLMTRTELTAQLQRAIDLGVMVVAYPAGENARLVCDVNYADIDAQTIQSSVQHRVERADNAARLTEAVLDGELQLDIDQLIQVCINKEEAIKKENILSSRRGGLSRAELADRIMQGIVNGALGIEYDQIAPYSHGYEVTFGGTGPAGSTRDFKNRWECYCDLFDIPMRIVNMIEKEQQDGRVFGKDVKLLNIHEMLQAIDDMEKNQITKFIPEKNTNFQRSNYPHRLGDVATVMDVHAGKGLDGIVQHHYHGTYSTMTPVRQNQLVETLVCMKGFCLDCLDSLDVDFDTRKNIVDYLNKQGTDITSFDKLQEWIRQNPEKCAKPENRRMDLDTRITKANEKQARTSSPNTKQRDNTLHR